MHSMFLPATCLLVLSLASHRHPTSSDPLPVPIVSDNNPYVGQRGPFFNEIKYAVLHHTQVRACVDSEQLYDVNNYHHKKFRMKSSLGWWVGYNWFCDVDGTLTQTRLVGEETAAQKFHNFDSDSICLAGDFNIDMPTEAQVKTLRGWLLARPNLEFRFHRDLADRTCPGSRITKEWIRSVIVPDLEDDEPPSAKPAPSLPDARERIRQELIKRGIIPQ